MDFEPYRKTTSATLVWDNPIPGIHQQLFLDRKAAPFLEALFVFVSELSMAGQLDSFIDVRPDYIKDNGLMDGIWNTESLEYSFEKRQLFLKSWLNLYEYGAIDVLAAMDFAERWRSANDNHQSCTFDVTYFALPAEGRDDYERYDPNTGDWLTPWSWD